MRFHPRMIAGLDGIIYGGVSVQDFSAASRLPEQDSEKMLEMLAANGFCTSQDSSYHFEHGAKLDVASSMLDAGLPIDQIAQLLDWRDFEGLTGRILSLKNFAVIKNLMLTKPRMEIDVVGIRLGVAMLIDCKHWKRYSHSSLGSAVKKQIERTRQYVLKTQGAVAVPVIVTLYQDKVNFIDRVPIVPIFQFASFVDEFYGNMDQMQAIKRD